MFFSSNVENIVLHFTFQKWNILKEKMSENSFSRFQKLALSNFLIIILYFIFLRHIIYNLYHIICICSVYKYTFRTTIISRCSILFYRNGLSWNVFSVFYENTKNYLSRSLYIPETCYPDLYVLEMLYPDILYVPKTRFIEFSIFDLSVAPHSTLCRYRVCIIYLL